MNARCFLKTYANGVFELRTRAIEDANLLRGNYLAKDITLGEVRQVADGQLWGFTLSGTSASPMTRGKIIERIHEGYTLHPSKPETAILDSLLEIEFERGGNQFVAAKSISERTGISLDQVESTLQVLKSRGVIDLLKTSLGIQAQVMPGGDED